MASAHPELCGEHPAAQPRSFVDGSSDPLDHGAAPPGWTRAGPSEATPERKQLHAEATAQDGELHLLGFIHERIPVAPVV